MSKCGIEGKYSQKHNTHYLRIKCVLQAHHENNAYCVRMKGVLEIEQSWTRCRYLQQVKYENFVDNLTKAIYNDYACYHGIFV